MRSRSWCGLARSPPAVGRNGPPRRAQGVSTEQLHASRKRSIPSGAEELGGLKGWAAHVQRAVPEGEAHALRAVAAALRALTRILSAARAARIRRVAKLDPEVKTVGKEGVLAMQCAAVRARAPARARRPRRLTAPVRRTCSWRT